MRAAKLSSWIALLASSFLNAPIAGAATDLISQPIKGVVVEQGTGKPIANAVVSTKWYGAWSSSVSGGQLCIKGFATQADEAGRFQIPAWTDSYTDLVAFYADVAPYKVGYQDAKRGHVSGIRKKTLWVIPRGEFQISATEVRVEMKAFAGSDEQRAEYLRRFLTSTACRESTDITDMRPLYLAIRVEVAQMPASIRDFTSRPSEYSLLEIIDKAFLWRTREGK